MELLIEELVEVTVLMEGLMPYGGYTPVIAAVWDTQAAGSMGLIGSPVKLKAVKQEQQVLIASIDFTGFIKLR